MCLEECARMLGLSAEDPFILLLLKKSGTGSLEASSSTELNSSIFPKNERIVDEGYGLLKNKRENGGRS